MSGEKIATRDGYGKALLELGKINHNVVALDADLSDSTRSEYFAKEFPERFFSMGIAEQNMMGAAAGLAFSGKIPYASTFAVFSERGYDFIRNIISRNKLNVRIAGSHSGIATGEDGKSAQAIEDIAAYRALPNMTILQPSDAIEAERMVFALADYKGPAYIRLHRNPMLILHDNNYRLEIGKGEILRKGKDAAIIATGTMVNESLKAAQILEGKGLNVYVANIHTIKPLDKNLVIELAIKTNCIITAEDHNIIGGLGGAVAEVLGENHPCRLNRIGLKDTYAESGKPDELYKKYRLDAESIAEDISRFVRAKGSFAT